MKKSHAAAHDSSGLTTAVAAGAQFTGAGEPAAYAFGPFRLVPGERALRRGDRALTLPPKAFDTLLLLVRNAGHLMRKEDLLQALWPETFVEEVNLANKVSLLRKVLGDRGPEWTCIETVAKQGYRFLPAVQRIFTAGARPAQEPAPVSPPRAHRFIALPFQLVNSTDEISFLAASLPEAISASLTGLRPLTVRSSLLAARIAESVADPRRIAEEADVDLLLCGRIVCDGDRLRVSAELVEAPTATVLGSFTCDASRHHLFEIQDTVVRRIVALLLPRLGDHDCHSAMRDAPASAGAYEYYLRGAHIERQRTYENMCVARDLFRQCVEEDPDYAPAWARLGRCYRFLDKFHGDGSELAEKTEWAFRRAFALNPDLAIAHHYFTPIEADSGRARQAITRLLGQAYKYPNDPDLFSGLVQATRYCGLLPESVRAHRRARALDSKIVTSVAHTHFLLGDYEGALEWYPPGGRYYLDAAAMAALGRNGEALSLLRDRTSLAPLVQSLRLLLEGDLARCKNVVREALAQRPGPDPERKFYLVRHLARAGAPEEAARWFRGVADDGFCCPTTLRGDPWLKPLAEIAGYAELLDDIERREADARELFERAGGARVLS